MSQPFYRLGSGGEVDLNVLRPGDGTDWDWWKLDRGMFDTAPLAGGWPMMTLQCECAEQRLPDLFRLGSKTVVSDRFRGLCDGFQVNAEFLPVNVVRPNGAPASDLPYWFLHVLERIDCIDYAASDYDIRGDKDNFGVARFRRWSCDRRSSKPAICSGPTVTPHCTSRRSCATPPWGLGSWSASTSWKEHKPNR